MKTLIILSDLWGFEEAPWLKLYRAKLEKNYEIHWLDSRRLAGIDQGLETEDEIHQQFVDSGIDRAVEVLKNHPVKYASVIGFSVGGLIAWKAALVGSKFKSLIAISSTRLRKEIQKPFIPISLFYGEEDSNRPTPQWFEHMNLTPYILAGGHDIYQSPGYIATFVRSLS